MLPGDTPHFHWARSGEYVTQVSAIGPLGLEYVNPKPITREPPEPAARSGTGSRLERQRKHDSGPAAPYGRLTPDSESREIVGRLLSVNVGMPKNVAWRGKTVFTGVFKDPVVGPRRVRKLNVEGDGQGDLAGHGGEQRAVFVYQIDSYRYWERELGRNDFTYGQFGENFTVEGLTDDEVCVGDRYQIGDAVFEVTQPRVTCYRVGIRMNDPRIPAMLVSHHRPGFYFRVLEEGDVQAGDEIIKLSSGPEQMPVAEVDALLTSRSPAPTTAARAPDPRAQPRLAVLVPSSARGRTRQRQRRSRADEPAARMVRLPSADRHRDHPRKRGGDLDTARGPRQRATTGCAPRPVPHTPSPARQAT